MLTGPSEHVEVTDHTAPDGARFLVVRNRAWVGLSGTYATTGRPPMSTPSTPKEGPWTL